MEKKEAKKMKATNIDSKEERKQLKDKATELAAELEKATMELTIELEDIANDIDEKQNRKYETITGLEYLSGKPRKGKPGPNKRESEKKEKKKMNKHRGNGTKSVKPNRNSHNMNMRVKRDNHAARKRRTNKHRNNDAKADKPHRNSHMKVKVGNLEASKAEKVQNQHATTLEDIKEGKARKF